MILNQHIIIGNKFIGCFFLYVHGDIIIEYCDQKRTCGATKILSFSFGSVDKFLDVFIADLYTKC